MRTTPKSELAGEIRKAIEKDSSQVLLYGAALVVVHLLNISPSELSALGAKFTLSSPIILRGVISILFLHKLHLLGLNLRYFYAYGAQNEGNIRLYRHTLQRHTKSGRTPKVVKLWTRIDITLWFLLLTPYLISFGFFIFVATALSLFDLVAFGGYCFESAPGLKALKDSLYL